jgi:hypothetical protein
MPKRIAPRERMTPTIFFPSRHWRSQSAYICDMRRRFGKEIRCMESPGFTAISVRNLYIDQLTERSRYPQIHVESAIRVLWGGNLTAEDVFYHWRCEQDGSGQNRKIHRHAASVGGPYTGKAGRKSRCDQ